METITVAGVDIDSVTLGWSGRDMGEASGVPVV
jgi:hypothetical protein